MVREKTERKLEKPTRNTLLRLLAIAYKEREGLEQQRGNKLHDEWKDDREAAEKQIMDELGLTLAHKRFENKWKKFTGQSIYFDDRIEPESIVGQRIIHLIGDEPKSPSVRVGNDYVNPALEREYNELRKTILTIEDFTVTRALELIENFRTGKA